MIIPLWLRLTFCTSAAWSSLDRLRWITPMPPWRAIPIAIRASVTRSIAADTSGIARVMPAAKRGRRVDCVRKRLGVTGYDDDVVERQRLEAVEESVIGVAHRSISWGWNSARTSTRRRCSVWWTRSVSAARVSSGSIGTTAVAEHWTVVDTFVGDEVDHHAGRRALAPLPLLPGAGDGVDPGQLAR